ncbi:BatA domain-containing protein [Pseudoduganella sp. S-14]|uniref:BatA domain-containing protein n=1 Tax=Pseudoduganella sp. S-14 TaxID=3404065 RepID=UPI003CF8FFAD
MTSMQPLWWFALPVLLLPVWWHMRKRERTRTDILATARFVPAAAPQQQRVLRWSDVLLLLVRMALLVVLIAWLAVLVMPWKGDTVFIDPSLESSPWAAQQVQTAGMGAAAREPLPGDLWNWLARNEHEWRPDARFLILASRAAMPALPPRLAHAAELRLAPSATAAQPPVSVAAMPATPRKRHIVVSAPAERLPRWQALFAAFSTAADGVNLYVLSDSPTTGTELIVWDHPGNEPPSSWKAPLWWRTAAANGQTQTPQGLAWTATHWPLQDVDAARALYERWQAATAQMATYPMPAQTMKAGRKNPLSAALARSPEWLALALLALFAIERILTHARRR